MAKTFKYVRPSLTTEWVPEVLDDWMIDNCVSKEWMSLTIGKSKNYISSCKERGRIGHDAIKKIVELTNIDKNLLTGKEKREVTEWKKPEGVNESKVGYWEFRGIKTDADGNPIFDTEKEEEPETNASEPKMTMPKGWLCLTAIDANIYLKADDIIQLRNRMNGTTVITNHGTFDVINKAWIIMECMKEC